MFLKASLLALLPALAASIQLPGYSGMKVLWQDTFTGSAGSPVNGDLWDVANGKFTKISFLLLYQNRKRKYQRVLIASKTIVKMNNGNNEQQTYTGSNHNLQLSGGGTVQLVPWRDQAAGWTSARIESKATFTPAPGKVTRVEASIRMGAAPAGSKAGVWPAFWMLGDAVHHGTQWPLCGELDVLEMRNGEGTAYGTAHCGPSAQGGVCNEPVGRGATLPVGFDSEFHTWSLEWDRRPGDWTAEKITWFRDGQVFNSLTGAGLGDQGTWSTLAHAPYYIILNVAVGGNFVSASVLVGC